jgi:hypothetical protein
MNMEYQSPGKNDSSYRDLTHSSTQNKNSWDFVSISKLLKTSSKNIPAQSAKQDGVIATRPSKGREPLPTGLENAKTRNETSTLSKILILTS